MNKFSERGDSPVKLKLDQEERELQEALHVQTMNDVGECLEIWDRIQRGISVPYADFLSEPSTVRSFASFKEKAHTMKNANCDSLWNCTKDDGSASDRRGRSGHSSR